MSFLVIPAMDLMGGAIVRLTRGDRNQITYYPESPSRMATAFENAGSRWLHLVNLDGAFDQGDKANRDVLRQLAGGSAQIQFGGGLRSLAAMRAALETGADRLVLGTLALEKPQLLGEAVEEFGEQAIAVAVDVRGQALQSHGWTEAAELDLQSFLSRLQSQSIKWLIYTDAERDGTGQGLAVQAAAEIQETFDINVIVSGGVGSLADVGEARQAGLQGVIIGKALYEGRFTIEEALKC